ncbi:MAG TPA: hypothetical protein VMV25_09115 [Steroidobacteraceae bacterium]|nr:hypothetical protein [Steroidobacteraceae bacterium]
MMTNDFQGDLAVRVDPAEMLQYVYTLMTHAGGEPSAEASSRLAARQWGVDTALARAAQLRWNALNRALGDARVGPWTGGRRANQLQVPAALIAASGVARLKMAEDEVEFDIPTLLDATLQLCEPAGNA